MLDPDHVAVPTQLNALMNQPDRRAVEAARVLEVAIDRNARAAATGRVESDGRQHPQRLALDLQALGDDEPARRVPARQRDAVAPASVDVVELRKRGEPAGRPEAGLVVADRALDRALSRGVAGVQAVAWNA
jgi:hypothetical protein